MSMTPAPLTIDPEDVRASARETSELPAWLEKVAEYVQRAASEGETVTLTAKQRMLTPEQVASLTGVSRSTISRKIKAGEIHAVKVGNRNRIPYEEYQRWWDQAMGDVIELVRDDLREDLFGTR
ncbi:Helix-turn-helix domain protein [Microbacterium ginsengisoli]|uniref:Helix-turn-helix domain protein n=2 Tax=Microbacteriaceae TaxID=85023 RepID=A0A0F0M2B8_9MICO|nr:Helix-turn-helix domain protein [Microbacterium ginsengisoli]